MPPARLALLLALAPALPACLPIPHTDQSAPAIDGVLLSEGRPVAGAPVRFAVHPNRDTLGCPAGSRETTTDAEGRFSFPAHRTLSPIMFFGDRWDTWRVCIPRDDGGVWEETGMWGGPVAERLECELGASGGPSRAMLPLPSISGAVGERGCWVRKLDHLPTVEPGQR